MPTPKVYEFSNHVEALCTRRGTDVSKLAPKLRIKLADLLAMIDGRTIPSKAIVAGLAKQLGSDVRFLDRLADEMRRDLA
jgi:hypothetical protein